MDSLASYGSDDDYEESSIDIMGTYKSNRNPSWNTQADVNYDEVQMDLSEESNNNNSGEDESSPRPNKASDRKRSYRSRSRDDPKPKGHDNRSSRTRRDRSEDRECHANNNDRDRTRKFDTRSKYDRESASNHEDRSDRPKYDREGQSSYEDRSDRSKYNRDYPSSHSEEKSDRSKHNREGQSHLDERTDRPKYNRDGVSNGEDRNDRSKNDREGPERSKHTKDEKNGKIRDDKNRKYRSGSKERKRSTSRDRKRSSSRERRRSGSKDRRRSRSPRRNDHKRRSNSKDRDRISNNNRGYGKRFDRTSNKMAQLEKLGIEIKTPDAEFVTPQMLLQRSMDEQVQKVKNSTGIELPKYYNPAAMNPARYADQIQKRRLLWQKKEPEAKVVPTNGATVNKVWEQTTFAQDQDGKVASKFKRLMGIKENPTTTLTNGKTGGKDSLKKQEEMFSSMEQQYEVARTATHTMRGVGLGFGTYQSYPR